ncbi:hypothetical protein ACET3Z_000147 [Daucus carota]
MGFRDIAAWNTMISGFSKSGMMSEACRLFEVIPERNDVTWNAMISGYAESGDLESAVRLFGIAPVKSVVAWTAMVSGYMKCGRVEVAKKVFTEMPVKNVVTWNSMIAGYVENGRAEDGVKLFRRMVESGVRPNSSSMSSVLLGCSELSALKLGKQVHLFISKCPLHSDVKLPASASSPSLTLRQSSSELFTDELPTLHPKSYVAMRQKARLQVADSAIHIIPFILIFSVFVLWFFSKPAVSW